MYPYLFQMIEEHPQVFFQVYTNGTLMTKEKAEKIKALGNAMVVVSCEGYEEETDRWRGPGVFKKIMEAMDHLREAHVLFGASATVTKDNVGVVSSEEWIDMLLDKGIFAQNYFLYIPVNGQGDINLMVTHEQRNHLRKQGIRFRNTKPMFIMDFSNDGPHNQNHLRPCMIIDNPHVFREVIEETKPYFTHQGADEVVTTMKEEMDAYAARFGALADKVWREEYLNQPTVPTSCVSSSIRQPSNEIGISMSMKSN